MLRLFLLVCFFRVLVSGHEATPFGDVDEGSELQDEESDVYEDEPIDHSAFLQVDDTSDLHIPKQTNRIRNKIR